MAETTIPVVPQGKMSSALAYWTDKQVDRRNAVLKVAPERKRAILADAARIQKHIEIFHYEQSLTEVARRQLVESVMIDIHRRDDAGNDGWADMYKSTPTCSCEGISSFRLGHAALIRLIGYDYDGYANPKTREGNAQELASLIAELVEMAAFTYANIPSRYYPLDVEDGWWITHDTMANTLRRGRLRVPLECMCLTAEELGDGSDAYEFGNLMTAEWWGRFLTARSVEIVAGRLIPLPTSFYSRMINQKEDGHGMDGGAMLACANILRHWESVRDDIDGWVSMNDIKSLCAVIDEIVGMIDDKVLLIGWDRTGVSQ